MGPMYGMAKVRHRVSAGTDFGGCSGWFGHIRASDKLANTCLQLAGGYRRTSCLMGACIHLASLCDHLRRMTRTSAQPRDARAKRAIAANCLLESGAGNADSQDGHPVFQAEFDSTPIPRPHRAREHTETCLIDRTLPVWLREEQRSPFAALTGSSRER